MLNFHEPTLSDKPAVDAILKTDACPTLEYNFTVQFIWKTIFNTKICTDEGFFFSMSGKEKPSFLFPAGQVKLKMCFSTPLAVPLEAVL